LEDHLFHSAEESESLAMAIVLQEADQTAAKASTAVHHSKRNGKHLENPDSMERSFPSCSDAPEAQLVFAA
jgi:hypothetical protein